MLGKRGHHIHAAASTLGMAVLQENISDLKTAIVHRACVDYLGALRGLTRMNGSAIGTKEQLEKFFRGTWFKMLCDSDIDGDVLILRLRKMNKQKRISIHYGQYTVDREELFQ